MVLKQTKSPFTKSGFWNQRQQRSILSFYVSIKKLTLIIKDLEILRLWKNEPEKMPYSFPLHRNGMYQKHKKLMNG